MRKFLFPLTVVIALAVALVVVGAGPGRSVLAQNAPAPVICNNATLQGTYVFEEKGSNVNPDGSTSPFEFSGFETYEGNGKAHGIGSSTSIVNGQTTVVSDVPFTAVYTVNSNCTVKEVDTVNGAKSHFDEFLQPGGDKFSFVQTDPGVIAGGTETRN